MGGMPSQEDSQKARRRAARQTIAAVPEQQLGLLLEHVREGFARMDAGEIDAFELDELIHRYKRSARELWKFCGETGSGVRGVAARERLSSCASRVRSSRTGGWPASRGAREQAACEPRLALMSRTVPGMRTSRVRVTLCEVEPVVVRVLDVPPGVVLSELHDLLQAVLGWTDSHLHQFVADGTSTGCQDSTGLRTSVMSVACCFGRCLRASATYMTSGTAGSMRSRCSGRGNRCRVRVRGWCWPAEDVGGPGGYAEFREALADPAHPEHDRLRDWAGEWSDGFDLAATNVLVRQMVGAVQNRFAWFCHWRAAG